MVHMSQYLANITQRLLSVADLPAASTTKISFAYASCTGHSDCDPNQFCGVKCWTGGCDEGRDDRKETTSRKFCQPCTKCERNTDSATHSCEICGVSGNVDDLAHSRLGPVLCRCGKICLRCRNAWRIFTCKGAIGRR